MVVKNGSLLPPLIAFQANRLKETYSDFVRSGRFG